MTDTARKGDIDDATEPDLAEAAGRLLERLSAAAAPLEAVAAARDLARVADQAMRAAVAGARTAGHTWQEIGDVLGSSRQAAFQRFGRPLDPRTGAPMTDTILPGAADRTTALVAGLADGRWEEVCRDFDETMAAGLSPDQLATIWAQVVGAIGGYERMGEPTAHQAADHTVVNAPLFFEAGELTLRVTYDRDGRTAGFYLLRPDAL
ncbi:DUF3887 domain-containing protein [Nonomuraea sp. NPDC049421]|uniref:DUF3887 domain-containing protein n=1 Tax=Nonomuraea sp. NPDC049421 TaxID=3155275 RepID=UPI003414A215